MRTGSLTLGGKFLPVEKVCSATGTKYGLMAENWVTDTGR